MKKETIEELMEQAQELRLAGGAIEDIRHIVAKAYNEVVGDIVGEEDWNTRTNKRIVSRRIHDILPDLCTCAEILNKISVDLAEISRVITGDSCEDD